MLAAQWWGVKPWEWDSASPEDKARIVATFMVNREVEGYYTSEAAKIRDRLRVSEEQKEKFRRGRR